MRSGIPIPGVRDKTCEEDDLDLFEILSQYSPYEESSLGSARSRSLHTQQSYSETWSVFNYDDASKSLTDCSALRREGADGQREVVIGQAYFLSELSQCLSEFAEECEGSVVGYSVFRVTHLPLPAEAITFITTCHVRTLSLRSSQHGSETFKMAFTDDAHVINLLSSSIKRLELTQGIPLDLSNILIETYTTRLRWSSLKELKLSSVEIQRHLWPLLTSIFARLELEYLSIDDLHQASASAQTRRDICMPFIIFNMSKSLRKVEIYETGNDILSCLIEWPLPPNVKHFTIHLLNTYSVGRRRTQFERILEMGMETLEINAGEHCDSVPLSLIKSKVQKNKSLKRIILLCDWARRSLTKDLWQFKSDLATRNVNVILSLKRTNDAQDLK